MILRQALADMLEERWGLDDGASFVADEVTRTLDGDRPLIRVYPIASPARPVGLGYTHRRVEHRLTVDIRSRSLLAAEAAREEVLRILSLHRIAPFGDDARYYVQALEWDQENDAYRQYQPLPPLSFQAPGYDLMRYDDGSYRGGGPGLSVWTIEVTIMQMRKQAGAW